MNATVNFNGSSRPLGFELCQSVAAVLAGASLHPVVLTHRASEGLARWRRELPAAQPGRTLLVHDDDDTRWYTFAGIRANLELAARLAPLRNQVSQRNSLYIAFGTTVSGDELAAAVHRPTPHAELSRLVTNVGGALCVLQPR